MKISRDKVMGMMGGLLISYIITGIGLLLLALGMFYLGLSKEIVSIVIILIYILSTFLGGFLLGKRMKVKRFFWGLGLGLLYFVVLTLLSLGMNHSIQDMGNHFLTTLFLCGGSGMLGGMLS